MRVVILRESAHLHRHIRRIEADDLVDHQCVGDAMRQVMERAELMRHTVADAEKRIGKRHSGHSGGVGHLFAGDGVVLPVIIGAGQIFEDHLEGAQRRAVGIVRRQHRGIGL
ncbi:hypothetical protein SDC9_197689 [bioreactor metagenome]|uniref:Uncharacterized protein n=1 Tax=bioreactor metagenome TaxID=1076179 RepID=A0A645IS79_9ZZZZ